MKKIIIVIVLIFILVIGWYLISPIFITNEVDEALPEGFESDHDNDDDEGDHDEDDGHGHDDEETKGEDSVIMPTEEEIAAMTEEQKKEAEMKMLEMFSGKDVVIDEEMEEGVATETAGGDAGPDIVSSGTFVSADSFHQGSGLAKILDNGTGQILRLEDFEVTNGPDLRVLLVSETDPISSGEVGEYIELGKLKGNKGNQNYTIPSGTDLSKFKNAVIYCKPFHVVFSAAMLQ